MTVPNNSSEHPVPSADRDLPEVDREPSGTGRWSLARLLLRLFVGSVTVNAVLGIWALLVGDFGETQGKVLATSFLVSAAMLCVLVNAPAMGRRALWPAPAIGAATGAVGFALLIVLLWAEVEGEFWFKSIGSLLVVAAATTLAASLALVPASGRLRWLPPLTDALIAALALTIVIGIWAEPDVDWYPRLLGIEGVLVAATTLLVPVLARFGGDRSEPGPPLSSPVDGHAIRFCPSCGRPLGHHPIGSGQPATCDGCGLAFEVGVVARSDRPGAPSA